MKRSKLGEGFFTKTKNVFPRSMKISVQPEKGGFFAIAGKDTKWEVASQGKTLASTLRNLAEAIEVSS